MYLLGLLGLFMFWFRHFVGLLLHAFDLRLRIGRVVLLWYLINCCYWLVLMWLIWFVGLLICFYLIVYLL